MTEHGAAGPTLWDLLWPVPNFLLFVGFLVYFLRGPVIEYFRARTARLREALQAGALARREAAELRARLARDIENLPTVLDQLRADLRAAAEIERDRLVEVGREAAERIRNDARLLGEYEFAMARAALRAELIDDAVERATSLLRGAIRPGDQERFVREFVSSAGTTA